MLIAQPKKKKNPHHCSNVPTSYFSWPAAPSSSLPPLGFPAAANIPCNLSSRAVDRGVWGTQSWGGAVRLRSRAPPSSPRARGIYETGGWAGGDSLWPTLNKHS